MYRKKITIDCSKVLNADHRDFPVLIRLEDPTLRAMAAGGHVASGRGEDVFFTQADGRRRLAHEMANYEPEEGALQAWVRLPVLSCTQDTELWLYYGQADAAPQEDDVWDAHCLLHLHQATRSDTESAANVALEETLTVEAWVHSEGPQAEVMQPLISQWEPLTSFDRFNAHDAGYTDGLDCVGFYGAVFDGRYVYFCPIRADRNRDSVHGHVLRYDTQGDFHDPHSYEAYDAGHTAGLKTVCYYGAAFDGRHVIFTPRDYGEGYHSRVLWYDTHMDFKSSASWDAFDVDLPHSHQGAAFDGRYVYFCPGYEGTEGASLDESKLSGNVLRMDTKGDFKNPSSYRVFDTKTISEAAVCFDGGVFDGRYIYFVPLTSGLVAQYDTKGDFSDAQSWRVYDAKKRNMKTNVGAVFDGCYIYFAAYNNSNMVRYDTRRDFTDDSSWETYDAANTSGLDTGGFDGGFFDGRYVYFVPWTRPVEEGANKSMYHCNFLRYDTSRRFDDPASWEGRDAGSTDGLKSIGYNAGAFDGRYFYGAPLADGDGDKFHGKVLRYDTLGESGSFSLRYCDYGHNGGLCAAVPGPSFLVNTVKGVVGVAAHKVLVPGWHHLAGVYNGQSIKLFVDGALVAERAGAGTIQTSPVGMTIGRFASGTARFSGLIDEVRVSSVARSDDWIKTQYQNLVNPSGFIRLGEEEQANG